MGRKGENTFSSSINNTDQDERHRRKRRNSAESNRSQNILNVEAKVYVGNIPTDYLSDRELLDYFKPFGKISDIRVYKGYLFVQFEKINDAKRLIKEGEKCLILKGNKLDVLPAMDQYIKDHQGSDLNLNNQTNEYFVSDVHSTVYQPPKKKRHARCSTNAFTVLQQSDHSNDCRILLVNRRQKDYAEEICSRLELKGMKTSIILLNEQTTIKEALEDTIKCEYHYAIILMGMHQQHQTISFHFLHQIQKEYRNVPLEDGLNLLIKDYEEHFIKRTDRYPLSMLLCLLADGRQLTLVEIDRILCYLLEKKASMLTLPEGTLPPLPFIYSKTVMKNEQNQSNEIIEQIEQILSQNFQQNENPSLINSSATDAAAKIFQAYSLFNLNPI